MISATDTNQGLRMSADEAIRRVTSSDSMTILDARSEKAYNDADSRMRGDVRIDPEKPRLSGQFPRDGLVIAYCT